jgi:hypothetical protein
MKVLRLRSRERDELIAEINRIHETMANAVDENDFVGALVVLFTEESSDTYALGMLPAERLHFEACLIAQDCLDSAYGEE